MQQQTISAATSVIVKIAPIPGDLRVAGWERAEIMAKTDGDTLQLTTGEGLEVSITCDENLILYLPQPATLNIERVNGDASLQALHGPITIGTITGDLTMRDVGPISLDQVNGDVSLRNTGAVTARSISGGFSLRVANGACAIEEICGDASIRDTQGDVAITNVSSDLYVRNVRGNISVQAGADVALYIDPLPGHLYSATAGDDILVRLPPEVNAELHLVGACAEDIQVNIPGLEFAGDSDQYNLVVGPAGENIAKIYLNAKDDLLVTCQADAWDSAADFGVEMSDSGNWNIPLIPSLPPDFSERINRRVQAAMERAQVHIETAGHRVETTGRRVEAAVRRAEAKARAAEVRARRGQINMNIGRWEWDLTPRGAEESQPQTSDEERLIILRMLREKKISLTEAESLLSALEGK